MKWRKRGLIFVPDGSMGWAKSYALIPTADVIYDETIRVYYSSLDENSFGRIGYLELDAVDPLKIKYNTIEPVIDLGSLGTFDDSGVNPSCIINIEGKKFLYYIGWQRTIKAPYLLFAGLAVSEDGGISFKKYSNVPILDRTDEEPFIRSATTVIKDKQEFRMWYVSAFKWENIETDLFKGQLYPNYIIKHASSIDGINWQASPGVCIDFKNNDEFGFGRPWVIKENGIYKMWYSVRARSIPYAMGYAESNDGYTWKRMDDEAGINASQSGWDSEMICYPCVIDVKGKRYMFYNGNRHGKSGFGFAELE